LRFPGIDPDATCVRRYLATGDRLAFETLFRKYQGPIFALVHRMVGNENAYDLTQDVFVRALRNLGTFRSECSFRTWIYTIARHVCYNYCRDEKRKNGFEEYGGGCEDEDGDGVADLPDPRMNVAKIAEAREIRHAAIEVLATLTPEQRLLITLRDFDQLSYEEIGDIMDLSLVNVKSKLHRARLAFKKSFQPYMELLDEYFTG